MLNRINTDEFLDNRWIFVHTHDGVQAAVRAIDAAEGGEGGLREGFNLSNTEVNVKDVK